MCGGAEALLDEAPAASGAPLYPDGFPPAGDSKRRFGATLPGDGVKRPTRLGDDGDGAFGSEKHGPIRGGFAQLGGGFSSFEQLRGGSLKRAHTLLIDRFRPGLNWLVRRQCAGH